MKMRFYGALGAAAFFSWAAAAAGETTLAAGAGVFQYYYDAFQTRARVGPAARLELRYEREESAYALEGRYRRYDEDAREVGVELRARYYFHAAPARPYAAPAVGFWLPRDAPRTYRVASAGARAGALLTAADGRLEVDVFGAYRGRFNFTADRYRPDFNSELVAGAVASWRLSGRFAVNVEGSLLWPAFFAERHGPLWGPGVAPFVLAGPSLSF
jgi:hypothetical protein